MPRFFPGNTWLDRLIRISAAIPVLAGLTVLALWLLGTPEFAASGQNTVPMAPSTALLFCGFGLALFFSVYCPHHPNIQQAFFWIILLGTMAASAMGLLSVHGIHPVVEHLGLVKGPVELGGIPLGHMSPLTAVAFLLAGVAFLTTPSALAGRFGNRILALSSATLLMAISLVLVLSYLFGVPLLYGTILIPPAFLSSLVFLPLGIGLALRTSTHVDFPLSSKAQLRISRLFLPSALVALFLMVFISITVWAGNTLTMITAIARFERTHTVSRVEAVAAFFDYRADKNLENLEIFQKKMATTQAYNKVFSRLLDMQKDTPDAEFVRILESTFSETDHKTAVVIVNRIKLLYWHPLLKELVADAVGAHAAGETLKSQVAQFLAAEGDEAKQQATLADIQKTRKEFIGYETSFSMNCSVLSNQISSYVTYLTIAMLVISTGIIGLLTYRIAKTVVQVMARDASAVAESRKLYRNLVENTKDLVTRVDLEGRLTFVNHASLDFFGLSPERCIGRSAFDFIHPEYREATETAFASWLKTDEPVFQFENRLVGVDGQIHDVAWLICIDRDENGKTIGFSSTARDITERKRAEEENAKLQAQLQQSQKMESLGTLAGGVAHDMNNVLGAILGLASAHIDNQPYGSPLHQALDTICKAAERGGKMVKSLLSFARHSPEENHQLDMNAILREQISLLERTTLAMVRLEIDLDTKLRPIQGDASALTHAFMNLCVNAVDAMPENGTLTLRTRNVDNDWVEVVVEDTGMGMPKEVLEKALEPFFTTKETGKGTGLGLSMVFSTVKAHRGQMAIESEPGHGTRVRLRFPACRQEVPVQPAAPAAPEEAVVLHKSMKVLLVDDDDLIQSSVQTILEVLGHTTVATARSGEEALAMLQGGFEPDLVILDMNMPGLGGIGTLPRLRVLRPDVPVLLATGRMDQTALTLASAHPNVTLLSKPFGLKELQKHLEILGLG